MSGKEFFKQTPYLVGGSISYLDRGRLSEIFGVMYQHEMDNPDSAFARNDEDVKDHYNRFNIFFTMLKAMGGNPIKIAYIEDIMVMKSLESYASKKGEVISKEYTELKTIPICTDIDTALKEQTKDGMIWWNS